MKFKILLFAHLREIFDSPEIELEINGPITGMDIINQLEALKPEISTQKKYLKISVDGEYAALDQPITSSGEIAVFPPVSGG